jgi:hypothetical protein
MYRHVVCMHSSYFPLAKHIEALLCEIITDYPVIRNIESEFSISYYEGESCYPELLSLVQLRFEGILPISCRSKLSSGFRAQR